MSSIAAGSRICCGSDPLFSVKPPKTRYRAAHFFVLALILSPGGRCSGHGANRRVTGLKGQMNEKEGVYKVTFPRNDVKVAVDGWTMPPLMGLGTWAAFIPAHDGAMVMGDTVPFEDEVNAAMSAALDNGLNVTALHNHFFFDHPKVYFMHIEGEGAVENLGGAVRKVYDAVKKIARPARSQKILSAQSRCRKKVQSRRASYEMFGARQSKDGMVKFSFGRPAKCTA